jgi:hypothetical protein
MFNQLTDRRVQKLVDKFSVEVKWFASRLCSCVGDNNGVRDKDCSCIGGYYYDSPKQYKLIRTAVNFKNITHDAGIILQGGATFTIPLYDMSDMKTKIEQDIYHYISRGDVIVIPAYTMADTDILTKGIRDEVWAFDIQSIRKVSQRNVIYREGRDYSYVGSGIIWHDSGNVPDEETSYGVEFVSYQQYLVWDDGGQSRGNEGQQLPKKVLCRLRPFGLSVENPIDFVEHHSKLFE